jgi:hypothetical protein
MATVNIQGRKVTVSDDFLKLSPEQQADTVDEIASQIGIQPGGSEGAPEQHSFSELPGNIIPSAIGVATGLYDMVRHPQQTAETLVDAAQGGVDRLVPEGFTQFMDTHVSPRSPETRERQKQVSGNVGQALAERYGGVENIKNTMITDPVGFGLDAASLAAPALGVAGKGPMASRAALSPATALDVGRPAINKLSQAIKADRVTPQQLAELGPEGMLMDAGPNLQKQGRGVFIHQGEGSQIIDEALQQRAQGTTPRALKAADDALGQRVNAVEQRERLADARTGQGSPLYKAAFNDAKAVNTNPVLEAIDNIIEPTVAGAGPESMSALGSKLTRYKNRLTMMNKGQVTDGRALQTIYRDIGDDIGEAVRKGRKGEASSLMEIKKKLEGSIDDATQGGFSKANQQWATDSEVMDAFGFGEDLAKNNLTPDEVMARLGKMKPQARPQVILGLRNWVYEVVGTARNDAAAARALLQRGWTQEKLGMVLGKAKADELAGRIGLERTYASTDQFVRRGSNTMPGASGAADVADPSLLGVGNKEALAYGGFSGLARKKALDMVEGVVGKLATHRGNVNRVDLAKMLTATGAKRDEIARLLSDPKVMKAFNRGNLPAQSVTALLQGLVAERGVEAVQRPSR